jgi:hypothetical protein
MATYVHELNGKKVSGFAFWLWHQQERDDPVGDFARDTFGPHSPGQRPPLRAMRFKTWRAYLRDLGATSDVITVAENAFNESVSKAYKVK